MRVPTTTYRLQLSRELSFSRVGEIVPYLASLGVTDLYLSPILAARPGSSHGYDGCDPTRLHAELGTEADLAALADAARAHGMALLVDFAPNHMAADPVANPWWRDVLENGPASPFARFFDIDWDPPDASLRHKVLLPVLGDSCAEVLARGELRIVVDGGRPGIGYFDRRFPLRPEDVLSLSGGASPDTPGALAALLERQHYRLAHFLEASRINYRRFFDVSDLVGLRVEDAEVFDAVHGLLLRLLGNGTIDGLRIDHVDGLRDPEGYLERLREAAGGEAWILVEKILVGDEELPETWPVAGTTGYEFLNDLGDLFLDAAGLRKLDAFTRLFTGRRETFTTIREHSKRDVVEWLFPGELEWLVERLARIAPDAPREELRTVLRELAVAFPVYRTYARETGWRRSDRRILETALEGAAALAPDIPAERFDLLAEALLPRPGELDEAAWRERIELALRFQQFTAPVQAKGVEDTAFYRSVALLCRNEVGGEPDREPLDPDAFHRRNAARLGRWPGGLLATSTHDTKRGEDARARLAILSQIADTWSETVTEWSRLAAPHATDLGDRRAPSRNDEILLYQTLVACWPPGARTADDRLVERVAQFLIKAIREEKRETRWRDRDEAYEAAVDGFARGVLADAAFLEAFLPLVTRVSRLGVDVSLGQVVLKAISPGVADLYQGSELWNLSLVDPDNRRPVDFAARATRLARLEPLLDGTKADGNATEIARLLESWESGEIKLFVTAAASRLRRSLPDLFRRGDYLAVAAPTPFVAAGRARNDDAVLAVATRHPGRDAPRDQALELPAAVERRPLQNVLTAEKFPLPGSTPIGRLLGPLPVALLRTVA